MNFELIVKYFAFKLSMFSDFFRVIVLDSFIGIDVMAAFGFVGYKCGFGFDFYFSKIGISSLDIVLERFYEQVRKLLGKFRVLFEFDELVRLGVFKVFCVFVYQDYLRSVVSIRKCDCCDGGGFIEA